MATHLKCMAPRLAADLHRVLKARFGKDPRATDLCTEFLSREEYDRELVTKLLAVSGGSSGDSWNLRLFATLMLANQCRHLDPGNEEECKFLFGSLGILSPKGNRINDRVLREGYLSTELQVFAAQFLGNLSRLERIHRKIQGRQTTARDLDEFICLSREACKLSLARYLFTPAEVVDRILNELNTSSGVTSPMDDEGERERDHHLASLPAYEKEIFRGLAASARVYWVSERTPSEINSIVERPLETVACAVKPPGSSIEFEIKRTGLRGTFPLTASFTYSTGEPLPPSHRLQGGASTASLRWESNQAAVISEIYRCVHGCEAPVSKLLSLATYRTVPFKGQDVHLLDYFTDPEVFSDAYGNMRAHMTQCVSSFDLQYGDELADLPGEMGLTGRFLAHVLPCQGILAQTSSFRLSTLATYLSPTGPNAYFVEGLKRESYTRQEAQRFADSLLDEVLGYIARQTLPMMTTRGICAPLLQFQRTGFEPIDFTPRQLPISGCSGVQFLPWAPTPLASLLWAEISGSNVHLAAGSGRSNFSPWIMTICAYPMKTKSHSGRIPPSGPQSLTSPFFARILAGPSKSLGVPYGASKRFTVSILYTARRAKTISIGPWREATGKPGAGWIMIRECSAFFRNRTSSICTIGM